MSAYRINKSLIWFLLAMICLGVMIQMPALYHTLENEVKVELYLRDFEHDMKPNTKMLLRVVNAPELMKDQTQLRPLANFTMTPRISLTGVSGQARWVAINMVKSAARNIDRRNVIRKTWGAMKTVKGARIETVFIIGTTDDPHLVTEIETENRVYGDLLQMNTPDGYNSVPHKTLAGMQWVAENTPGGWLYSSADDDVVLHPENFARFIDDTILKYMTQVGPGVSAADLLSKLPIMCIYSYNEGDPPARDPKSKWYLSPDIYPPLIWPPYCRGGWYTIPVSVVSKLHRISRKTLYIRLDDVWVTGIMRLKMLASQVNFTENALLNSGIIAAPLAVRSDAALIRGDGEGDVSKVIVRHVWGNTEHQDVSVTKALLEIWKSWEPSLKVANDV